MWPVAVSHELLEIFGQASSFFLVSWAVKRTDTKVLGTFQQFKVSQYRPVEVEFSSASSPGRGFFWNELHPC